MSDNFSRFFLFWKGSLRRQFFLTLAVFCLLALGGYGFAKLRPEVIEELYSALLALLNAAAAEVGTEVSAESYGMLDVISVFLGNAYSLMFSVLLGFIPFLYLPAVSIGGNALVFGMFAAFAQSRGLPLAVFLLATLPHGIFEFAALILACSAGLYLCGAVTDRLRRREGSVGIGTAFSGCMLTMLCGVLPLLLISAVVEVFVTPMLIL